MKLHASPWLHVSMRPPPAANGANCLPQTCDRSCQAPQARPAVSHIRRAAQSLAVHLRKHTEALKHEQPQRPTLGLGSEKRVPRRLCFLRTPYCSCPSEPMVTSTFSIVALPHCGQNSRPASCNPRIFSSLLEIWTVSEAVLSQRPVPAAAGKVAAPPLCVMSGAPHAVGMEGLRLCESDRLQKQPSLIGRSRGCTLVTKKHAEQRSTQRLSRMMRRPLGVTSRNPICSSTFCIEKSAVTLTMLLVDSGSWLSPASVPALVPALVAPACEPPPSEPLSDIHSSSSEPLPADFNVEVGCTYKPQQPTQRACKLHRTPAANTGSRMGALQDSCTTRSRSLCLNSVWTPEEDTSMRIQCAAGG